MSTLLSAVPTAIVSALMAVRRDLSRVAILATLLIALLPGAALAAPAWLDWETLVNTGGASGAPDVVAFGDETAVLWTGVAADASTHVYASVRPRDRLFLPAEDLEPGGGVTLGDVHVVALPSRELVAVWLGTGGGTGEDLRWARRPPGGPWTDAASLTATSCCAQTWDLVAADDGSTTVLWNDNDGLDPRTNTLQEGSETWGPVEALPNSSQPVLAVAPDGSAVAASRSDSCCGVEAAFKPSGASWGNVEPVDEGSETVTGIALAARPDDGFAVLWTGGGTPGTVRAEDRTAGVDGEWEAEPQTVAELTGDQAGCLLGSQNCLDLAAGADGTLAAVWGQGPAPMRLLRSQLAPTGAAVAASMRSPAGDWGEAASR